MQAFVTSRQTFCIFNYSKQLFSHIPPQFQFNGLFQQSERLPNYFFSIVINSSLSFINEQIFRLLLKISVYERHQLRIQAIYQASFEEAITTLDLVESTLVHSFGSFAVRVTNILASGNLTKPFQINLFTKLMTSTPVGHKNKNEKVCKIKNLKPTAPSVPRRSPIQVLTKLNIA